MKWAFGEISPPNDKRFEGRLKIAIWTGIVCWPAVIALTLVSALLEDTLSSSTKRGLDIANYGLGSLLVLSWFIIPTVWNIRYGSRFGRRAQSDRTRPPDQPRNISQ
jgi:hypothetical protein